MTERIQRSWTKHDSALSEGTAKAAWIRTHKKRKNREAEKQSSRSWSSNVIMF
jgi:hypothetical protein